MLEETQKTDEYKQQFAVVQAKNEELTSKLEIVEKKSEELQESLQRFCKWLIKQHIDF